ncbi:hypothetical protein TRVL_08242 [Trypanosoma vivax]|nr:hypothetical protein TRVL_08242 [Trypanosoma vivax]
MGQQAKCRISEVLVVTLCQTNTQHDMQPTVDGSRCDLSCDPHKHSSVAKEEAVGIQHHECVCARHLQPHLRTTHNISTGIGCGERAHAARRQANNAQQFRSFTLRTQHTPSTEKWSNTRPVGGKHTPQAHLTLTSNFATLLGR